MKTELTMGKQEWLLLFVLSVIWGGSFFFAKVALQEIHPMTLVLLRVSLASMALWVLIKGLKKKIPKSWTVWKTFIGMGILNNLIPFSLLFWSQTYISSGLASIFNASVPIFTVMIAHYSTRDERLTTPKFMGVMIGVLGVAVMIGADLNADMNVWVLLAMLACVGAALSYGFASVYGRKFQTLKVEPLVVAFGQVTASAVIMLVILLIMGTKFPVTSWSIQTMASVLALALVSTALAYVIFFRILARGGATNISLVTLLIPVSAIVLGVTFLDEKLAISHVVGMLIVFIGLIVLDGRLWRIWKSRRLTKNCVNNDIKYKMTHWRTKCKL